MYSACLVLREKTKFVLVAWRKYPEWSKLAWVLYSCVRMAERDMEMLDAEGHISANGIYR